MVRRLDSSPSVVNTLLGVGAVATVLLGLIGVLSPWRTVHSGAASPTDTGPKLTVDELPVPYRTFALFVDPGQTIDLRLGAASPHARLRWGSGRGTLSQPSRLHWQWKAPRTPGRYELRLQTGDDPRKVVLHVFVKVPARRVEKGVLNGYHIGSYPEPSPDRPAVYNPPTGFVEVTRENRSLPVTPHFTLGEFLCKQSSSYPKYLVLRERLLLKLEAMLKRLKRRDRSNPDFTIMSGYRTPVYNRSLGNVPNSRHLWGGAADIYVDRRSPGDVMDDLNRDGELNWRDARWLSRLAPTPDRSPYPRLVGGIGVYGSTRYNGPFVHVDVRGYRARWSGNNVPG